MNKLPFLMLIPAFGLISCGAQPGQSSALSSAATSSEPTSIPSGEPSATPSSDPSEEASRDTSEVLSSEESEEEITALTAFGLSFRNEIEGKTLAVSEYGESDFLLEEGSQTKFDVSFGLDATSIVIKFSDGKNYLGYEGSKTNLNNSLFTWTLASVTDDYWGVTAIDSKSEVTRFLYTRHQKYAYSGVDVDKYSLRAYAAANLGASGYSSAPAYLMDATELRTAISTISSTGKKQRAYEGRCYYNLTYNKKAIDSETLTTLKSWGSIK